MSAYLCAANFVVESVDDENIKEHRQKCSKMRRGSERARVVVKIYRKEINGDGATCLETEWVSRQHFSMKTTIHSRNVFWFSS